MNFIISNLVDHPHFGPILARWHAAEWGHLYNGPGSSWNEDIATEEFAAMKREVIPLTLIALDEQTHELIGSVSLIADDELHGFAHLTPWLASLYVVPSARNRRVASTLINRVSNEAHRLGHTQMYLFTSGQSKYYSDRGWHTVALTTAHGHRATVMSRATSEGRASQTTTS
jgi:N-acetylglutamate synthase-like GNAT family acetyltransferase